MFIFTVQSTSHLGSSSRVYTEGSLAPARLCASLWWQCQWSLLCLVKGCIFVLEVEVVLYFLSGWPEHSVALGPLSTSVADACSEQPGLFGINKTVLLGHLGLHSSTLLKQGHHLVEARFVGKVTTELLYFYGLGERTSDGLLA